MKKIVSLLLSVLMLFVVAYSFAEEDAAEMLSDELSNLLTEQGTETETEETVEEGEPLATDDASDPIQGVWYATQMISGGIAQDLTTNTTSIIFTFNSDGTGAYNMVYEQDPDNPVTFDTAWKKNEDGTYSFMEVNSLTETPMEIKDDYVIIGTEDTGNVIVLKRDATNAVNFAPAIVAKDASEFDGNYAVTYVAGKGFSLSIEKAMDLMSGLGVNSTGVSIQDKNVELFGAEIAEYVFDEETGTLYKDVDQDAPNVLDVRIYKLENGGIVINWMGLSFYANPTET